MADHRVIEQYTGRNPRIDDPLTRQAFRRGIIVSEIHYPAGTADYDQKCRQVILNEETADYLYTEFTPLSLHYLPGSRPVLERVVKRILRPDGLRRTATEMTEREKVIAIHEYCLTGYKKDYPNSLPAQTLLLNASEEEILKLGGGQCEDRSRLICCLCQIAGIPARFIAVYSHFRPEENHSLHGGHAIVEIWLEGAWAFFDSSVMDFYCLREDGRIASLWELRCRPELVERQGDEFYRARGETKERFIWYRDEYLSTRAIAAIANYYVWDGWRYDWNWLRISYDAADEASQKMRKLKSEVSAKLLAEIGIHPK